MTELEKLNLILDGEENRSDQENPPKCNAGLADGAIYSSDDFVHAFHHFEADPAAVPVENWIVRTLIAVFLLKCLKSTTFFERYVSANRVM